MNNDYQQLLRAVEQALGRSLISPSDFEYLANQLFEKTHEHLSTSTLMRLWGYTERVKPRKSTLDVLARFLGYNDSPAFFNTLQPTTEVEDHADEKAVSSSRKAIFYVLLAVVGIGFAVLAAFFFAGGEEKPRRILKLSELKNTKMYRISSRHGERGELGVLNHELCTTFELAQKKRCLQPADFAILKYEGNYYLYSVSDSLFVNFTGHFVDAPIAPDGVKLTLAPTPSDSCFSFIFTWREKQFTLNMNEGNGIIITDYGVATGDYDEGNMLEIYEVGDFDPTEPLKRFAQLKAEHEKANQSLVAEQTYCIYTLQDAKGREGERRHYVAANGRLTDAFNDSCRFVFHPTQGDTLYASPSFRICSHVEGLGVPQGCPRGFTNILYGNEQRTIQRGHIEVREYHGDIFSGQAFLLGSNGCYAIRSTNVPMSFQFAGAYWCVVDADNDGSPDIDYSAERQYVWHIEPTDPK